FNIALKGFGLSQAPSAVLSVSNNNLGGAAVGSATQRTDLATITNYGSQTLTIGAIQVGEGASTFQVTGVPANLASNPISLAFGQSFTFGVRYSAGHVGLERGKINVTSNDPLHAIQTIGVVGTGLAKVVYPDWGNDFVATEFPGSTAVTLRAVS